MRRPRNWLRTAAIVGGCLVLAACAMGCTTSVPVPTVPIQPVTVAPDTLCRTKRPSWSIFDTADTIAEQTAAAELWDRKCARRGKAKAK